MDYVKLFTKRVQEEWLPVYCAARDYSMDGFKASSVRVHPADARDCMLAIDQGLVTDNNDGRYRAPRSEAHEVLFWEGLRSINPRPITLWLEPVITFAALARLHFSYAWPRDSLCAQPVGWAFDLAAYEAASTSPQILGEIKKSVAEVNRLRIDFLALSAGVPPESVSKNSRKKWQALVTSQPKVVWLLGPGGHEYIFSPAYTAGSVTLTETSNVSLWRNAP